MYSDENTGKQDRSSHLYIVYIGPGVQMQNLTFLEGFFLHTSWQSSYCVLFCSGRKKHPHVFYTVSVLGFFHLYETQRQNNCVF